jgi:membrane protein
MAPGGTGELLAPLFEEAVERSGAGTASFGIAGSVLVAFWSGSRAIGGLLKGFRRIRGQDVDPPLVWNRAIALSLALVLGGVLVLSIAVFLFGGAVGRGIADLIGLGDTFSVIWRVISWPLMAFVVVIVLAVLYRFGMGHTSHEFRIITAGSVTGAVLWLVIMAGIRVYLMFIDVGSIYGVLGSFMIVVVFFYVMSLALLFGAAIDAVRQSGSAEPESQPAQTST